MNFFEFLIKQVKILNLIIIIIILGGLSIFINGQKEAFPQFMVNEILINIMYPGAPAKTVENLITYPVENCIINISGIKKIESSSKENISSILVSIDSDYENKLNDIKIDIQNKIDEIELPADIEDPQYILFDSSLIPVLRVLITGESDEWKLKKIADSFKKGLIELDGIRDVDIEGYREEEIKVECDQFLLKQKGISISEVISAIRNKNINIPGGEIYRNNKKFLIRVRGFFSTIDEIKKIVIRANEDFIPVYVDDIAKVYRGFKRAEIYTRVNGQKGTEFVVKKNKKGDNIKISNSVQSLINKFKIKYPDISFIINSDTSIFIKNRLKVLGNNAFIGLVLLIIILLIFFDFKTSFWTVMGMPVAFCTTMIVSNLLGITLNLMSMFGFIIVVGMIVDDAIVVAENIYKKNEEGLPKLEATISGVREMLLPIFTSIATTIAAFMPLLFISGIIGKFFGVIPKVVSITLAASFVEAIFVLPAHLYHSKINPRTSKRQSIFLKIKSIYERLLTYLLKHKYKTLIIFIISSMLIIILLALKLPFQFSPGRINEYEIKAEFDPGFSLDMTEEKAIQIESFILSQENNKYVQDVITTIGQYGLNRFIIKGENKINMRIILKPDRPSSFDEFTFKKNIKIYINQLSDLKDIEIDTMKAGPPQKKAINIIVTGRNFTNVYTVAQKIKAFTETISNTSDLRLDYDEGKSEFVIDVDEVTSAAVNLTPLEIATAVRHAFDGGIATSIKEKGEDINVRVKYDTTTGATLKTLKYLQIMNRLGKYINFSKVASIKKQPGVSEIKHYNSKLTIIVMGNLDNPYHKKYTSSYINKIIKNKFSTSIPDFPDTMISYSGEDEDVVKSLNDLKTAYMIAFVLIIILLLGLFKSYSQIFIIVLTIPFGIAGVFIGLFVSNLAISYTSLIGMIALSGVVVNDAIIMIDKINKNMITDSNHIKAVISGAVSRIRAVILTTLTTMVGIIPMAYGFGGKEEFLQPLGVVIVWGIFFATLLTLIFIPILYCIIEIDIKNFISKNRKNTLSLFKKLIANPKK